MKTILTFLILLNSVFVIAQTDENNADREVFKSNKVKSVTIYKSKNPKGKPGKREEIEDLRNYDTNGLLIEYYSYNTGFMSGNYHVKYRYDSTGKITADIGYILKNDSVPNYYTYKYDSEKRVIEKQKDKQETWIFTYDSSGNVSTQKWFVYGNDYANSFFLDSFQYDSKKHLTKMTRCWDGGPTYFYLTYEYDSIGNKIKETRVEKGLTTDIWTYSYNENGHLAETKHYDGLLDKSENSDFGRTYDKNGLILSDVIHNHYRRYVYEYY